MPATNAGKGIERNLYCSVMNASGRFATSSVLDTKPYPEGNGSARIVLRCNPEEGIRRGEEGGGGEGHKILMAGRGRGEGGEGGQQGGEKEGRMKAKMSSHLMKCPQNTSLLLRMEKTAIQKQKKGKRKIHLM